MKKDNIEEVYGKLKGFEKQPPQELWGNIEANLQPKKKRRGIFFWIGSAAALLFILLGYIFYDNPNLYQKPENKFTTIESATDKDSVDKKTKPPIEIVNQNKTLNPEDDTFAEKNSLNKGQKKPKQDTKSVAVSNKEISSLTSKIIKNSSIQTGDETQVSSIERKTDSEIEVSKEIDKEQLILKNNTEEIVLKNDNERGKVNGVVENNITSESDTLNQLENKSIKDLALEEPEENTIEKKSSSKPNWLIEVSGGVSNTASESVIQNASVQTSAQNDLVYSLKFGYALSERLVVKTGIGNNVLGQEVGNIPFARSANPINADASLNIVNNENIILLVSEESLNSFSNDLSTASSADISLGTFQQQFNYLQIPVEFSYDVIQKEKFNIAFGFGGNVNFLNDNTAFLNEESVGENLNVNSTLLGATLLTNFSYDLSKSINIFVEPNYNYFQKPVDNANQDFRNTQFRFLFGVQYKFK
jgi:hypothetical protein